MSYRASPLGLLVPQLLGANATESAFKRADLAHYRYIHLAVHGFASEVDPDRSALLLGSDPAHGEDGFLQASEIVQMRLNADMVVLSACDTALGPVEREEGIAAISRAFLLAGARSVVSTLWSIDDTFSSFLMKQFYGPLATGTPPTLALAAAKAGHGEQIRPISAALLLGCVHHRGSRGLQLRSEKESRCH